MEYQLVLQFDTACINDFDALIDIEETIRKTIEPQQIVDGHDFGQNEMNIFVHTDYPDFAFKEVFKLVPEQFRKKMKAAYRKFDEENYTSLHPKGSTDFNIK